MKASKSLSKKCRIGIIVFICIFSIRAFGQNTIAASEIVSKIKAGDPVNYENAVITGVVDFTDHQVKLASLPSRAGKKDNQVKESISNKVSFVNCVFEDDVLAYIHLEESGYTFTADFDQDVVFQNCEFRKNAMFKYSDFDKVANFSNSSFFKETTFKYANFDRKADFSKTTFQKDAIFKYTEFDEGVDFSGANFEKELNIKYMNARGDFDLNGIKVDEVDAKYTKINGSSFSAYLLNNQ